MVVVGNLIVFGDKHDFMSSCAEDPYGRGYTILHGCIKPPSSFPAVYKYEPDWDPHCIGSYVEMNFRVGIESMLKRLREQEQEISTKIATLNHIQQHK